MVHVYLDLDGLFQRLRAAGFSHELGRIYQFSRGFTQRQPLFDLVDVGFGSHQVALKIEGDWSHFYGSFSLVTDRLLCKRF